MFVSGQAQNAIVTGDKRVYSEVSSRGYLVASDDAFVCSVISYSEVKIGLETHKKEQKLGVKSF